MPDLLPCPFCGGESEAITGPVPRKWGTRCKDCDAWRDDRYPTETEAIAAWNRRAPVTLAAALALPEIKALVDAGNRWRAARTKFADDGSRRVLVGDEWQHLGQAESDMDTALRRIAAAIRARGRG